MSDKLEADLVVASDLHIRAGDDGRARLLIDLVDRLGPATGVFVLNGDVFDFCFGGSAYFRRKFRDIGAALGRLAQRGTRVVLVEGNHEFHMREMGWTGVEVTTAEELVLDLPGARVKISHGDLITNDRLYRAFRALVKSRFARALARLVPGVWLDTYALGHAKVSRAQDKYRTLDHGRILAAFERWMAAGASAEHGVIGHFHVPYAEPRQAPAQGRLVSVDSWDKPNALLFRRGAFERVFLRAPGAAFQPEPAAPVVVQSPDKTP